jgi:hypothetical protein
MFIVDFIYNIWKLNISLWFYKMFCPLGTWWKLGVRESNATAVRYWMLVHYFFLVVVLYFFLHFYMDQCLPVCFSKSSRAQLRYQSIWAMSWPCWIRHEEEQKTDSEDRNPVFVINSSLPFKQSSTKKLHK